MFRWLRPVVLYVISLAGGMGLGILLWYMVSGGGSMTVLVLCQIVTGLIVYFGVQMLLHKSFRERPHMRRRARKPVHQQHAVFPLPHLVWLTQGRGKVRFRARFHVASSLLHSGNRFLFAHHQQHIARHQHCFCAG